MPDHDDDVQLTDLEVIAQFSLAVRGATASRADVIAALEADLAYLTGRGRAPRPASRSAAPDVQAASAEPARMLAAKTPVTKAPASRTPAVKAPASSTPPVRTPASRTPAVKTPTKKATPTKASAMKAPAKKAPVKAARSRA